VKLNNVMRLSPLSFERDRAWWEKQHGADAYRAWCETVFGMLTRPQQRALREPENAHVIPWRKLCAMGLARTGQLTPLGRDVLRAASRGCGKSWCGS